jgi:uncharacterized membrane protein
MPESFYDTVVILFFTVLPVILILLQILLSSRKKIVWGFVVPLLWTALGIWMIAGRQDKSSFTAELVLFFAAGDIILIGIMLLVRYLKKRHKRKHHDK